MIDILLFPHASDANEMAEPIITMFRRVLSWLPLRQSKSDEPYGQTTLPTGPSKSFTAS
jgi:hypothetical protein